MDSAAGDSPAADAVADEVQNSTELPQESVESSETSNSEELERSFTPYTQTTAVDASRDRKRRDIDPRTDEEEVNEEEENDEDEEEEDEDEEEEKDEMEDDDDDDEEQERVDGGTHASVGEMADVNLPTEKKSSMTESAPMKNPDENAQDPYAFIEMLDNEEWRGKAVNEQSPMLVDDGHLPPPLKRKNGDPLAPKARKKIKKARNQVDEGGDLDVSDDEGWERRKRESEIENLLKNRQFIKTRNDTEAIASIISRESAIKLSRQQHQIDTCNNVVVGQAVGKLNEVIGRGKVRGLANKAKVEKEARQKALEVIRRTTASLNSIPESTIEVHVHDITWDKAFKPDMDAVGNIKLGLSSGTKPIVETCVRGYFKSSEVDGERILFIHSGVENVIAYRELAEGLQKAHPDKYKNIEDRTAKRKKCTKSQPPERSSKEASTESPNKTPNVRREKPPILKEKERNPFAYIFAMVLNENSLNISSHAISMYKAMKRDVQVDGKKQSPLIKIMHYLVCAETLNMNTLVLKQVDVNNGLKKLLGWVNETIARTLMLDNVTLKRLTTAMEMYEEFDKEKTVKIYMNARKISSVTADTTLNRVIAREYTADEAISILEDHDKRIHYLFRGLAVGSAESSIVENRLEGGNATLKKIKELVSSQKRFNVKRLIKIKRDPEQILKIIERELQPCIGFRRARVFERPQNDGKGEARCSLAFISHEDLADNPNAFSDSLVPRTLMFVTSISDTNLVADILNTRHPNIGTYLLTVNVHKYAVNDSEVNDVVSCVVIGGKDGRVYPREELIVMLNKAGVYNKLENWQMRKLIFNVSKVGDSIKSENKSNTVFVHSTTPAVTAIVANLSLNRVYTSATGQDLIDFDERLANEQRKRSEEGLTFSSQPPKMKNKKRVDDEDNSDDGENDSSSQPDAHTRPQSQSQSLSYTGSQSQASNSSIST